MSDRTELLKELGFSLLDFENISHAPTFEEASVRLVALKDRFKKVFKKSALRWHPDKSGGDPVKTKKFIALMELKSYFDQLQVIWKGPPIQVKPFRYYALRPLNQRAQYVTYMKPK